MDPDGNNHIAGGNESNPEITDCNISDSITDKSTDICSTDFTLPGKDHLIMDDIITDWANMMPGMDRFFNRITPILLFQVLIHNNGIIT